MEQMGRKAFLGRWERTDRLDQLVSRVRKGRLVLTEHADLKGREDRRENEGRRARLDPLVLRGLPVQAVPQVLQV